jgi:hypothetical protein
MINADRRTDFFPLGIQRIKDVTEFDTPTNGYGVGCSVNAEICESSQINREAILLSGHNSMPLCQTTSKR